MFIKKLTLGNRFYINGFSEIQVLLSVLSPYSNFNIMTISSL